MDRRIHQFVVGSFAFWLVALSEIVYPQLTAHIAQHEHHKASTHATALCSWLCIEAGNQATSSLTGGSNVKPSVLPERLDDHGMPE